MERVSGDQVAERFGGVEQRCPVLAGEPVGGQVHGGLCCGLDMAAHLDQGIERLIAHGAAAGRQLSEGLEHERAGPPTVLVGMAELLPTVVPWVDRGDQCCDRAEVTGGMDGLVDQFSEDEDPRVGSTPGPAQLGASAAMAGP